MIKVLIADDHQLLIDGIRSTLRNDKHIKIVAEAHNGLEVLEKLDSLNGEIDVILMDIYMPEMNGLDCTRMVCKKYPEMKVIALSQYDERRFVKKMIRYGSTGYLLKDASKSEIIEAIHKVNEGGEYFTGRISDKLFKPNENNDDADPLFPKLTVREKEVLKLICEGNSSHEISAELNISYHTVESHRANLMVKTQVKNTAGLVRWAIENDFYE